MTRQQFVALLKISNWTLKNSTRRAKRLRSVRPQCQVSGDAIFRFPRGIDSVEKVLICEIRFQDLEKVWNLAKMYIKYWKSMEILLGERDHDASEQNNLLLQYAV